MMNQNEVKVLIEKLFAGQCTEDEIKVLNQWYDSFDGNRSFTNQLSEAGKAALEKKLLKGINARVTAFETRKSTPSTAYKHWYKAAACVAFVITACLVYFFIFNATLEYATAYAETRRIILPDSSSVVLNANSALTYKRNWNFQETREVWLEGEAFFEVQKRYKNNQSENKEILKAKPEKVKFIVHTDNLDVEVLGTTFNVNHRRGKTQVVLNTGKVEVKGHTQEAGSIMMEPGNLVELSNKTNGFSKKMVDPEDYSAWQYQKMVFKRTPLSRVAEIFQDYYGVEMLFKDKKIGARQVTGSIPTNDMEIFLEILSESMRLNITRTGGQVRIENKITVNKK